ADRVMRDFARERRDAHRESRQRSTGGNRGSWTPPKRYRCSGGCGDVRCLGRPWGLFLLCGKHRNKLNRGFLTLRGREVKSSLKKKKGTAAGGAERSRALK